LCGPCAHLHSPIAHISRSALISQPTSSRQIHPQGQQVSCLPRLVPACTTALLGHTSPSPSSVSPLITLQHGLKGVYHTHQLVGLRLPWRLDSHETHYELCQPLNYPPHRATQWGVDATCSPLHGHTLLAWLLRQRSRDITVCGRRRRRRGRWKKNTKRKFCTHKHRNRRKTQTHIRASAPSAEFRVPERAPCAPPMNETYLL
jgi:hypothetical protein